MTLGEFLQRPLPREWNCSLEASDWCVALGHPDFAAPWRPITDPTACRVASEGILLDLWCGQLDGNLPVAHAPYEMGDIAVIVRDGEDAGAIFTGDKWTLRGKRMRHFLAADSVRVLRAWRP